MALRAANDTTGGRLPPRDRGCGAVDPRRGLLPYAIVSEARRFWLVAAYAAVCVIWGSTYLAIKVGLESFDPFFYAGMRYLLAAAVAFGVARWQGVPFPGPLARWWPAAKAPEPPAARGSRAARPWAASGGLVPWRLCRSPRGT